MKENQSHEARRRAFIRKHHPDRGGDAGEFIAGLRALDAEREQGSGPLPEVVVVRRRPWLVRKATAVGRRLRYGPRPSRVRLPVTACPLLVVLRRCEKNLFVTWLGHRPFGGESRGLADGDVRQPVRFVALVERLIKCQSSRLFVCASNCPAV